MKQDIQSLFIQSYQDLLAKQNRVGYSLAPDPTNENIVLVKNTTEIPPGLACDIDCVSDKLRYTVMVFGTTLKNLTFSAALYINVV